MLFEMNENPKVIQQLLGHRDVKTTLTRYTHSMMSYKTDMMNKMGKMLAV